MSGKKKKEYYSERNKDIIRMYEQEGLSLDTIGKYFGVTKQAISLILRKYGYQPRETKKLLSCKIREEYANSVILQRYDEMKENFEKANLKKLNSENTLKIRDVKIEKLEKQLQQLKAENRELKAYRDVMEQADFKGSFDKMCVENRELIAKLEDIEDICRNGCYINADDIQDDILQILDS